MRRDLYLLDTHALLFWNTQKAISRDLIEFLDKQEQRGTLHVSSISFWEIALLVKKGKLALQSVHLWKNELMDNTNLQVVVPSIVEMINSTELPEHHKDPFDRLLIAQANQHDFVLVTQDRHFEKYEVRHTWM